MHRSSLTERHGTESPIPTCAHHGCLPPGHQAFLTVPTYLTFIRLVASTGLLLLALRDRSITLALAGLAAYWVGDIADGLVARRTNRETRTGAVLDILADRLACGMFYVILGMLHPDMLVPIGLYLVEFMVLDCYLSLAFLDWPLISPNYFFRVSPRVFRLNWTPVAKSTNTGALLVIILTTHSAVIATVWMALVAAVKIYSVVQVQRLSRGIRSGCAAAVIAEPPSRDVTCDAPCVARHERPGPALLIHRRADHGGGL